MRKLTMRPVNRPAKLHKNQQGITGLETAIAFVVVASVFAFAVLST